MIDIQDLSLLKITKVRSWSICFDYDNKHYLLHGNSECGEGSWQDLYERELDKHGKYKFELVKTKMFEDDRVAYDYIRKQNGRTIVYSLVDKKYFAYKLTKRGFAIGIFEHEVRSKNEEILKLKSELDLYENKCRQLRCTIESLS